MGSTSDWTSLPKELLDLIVSRFTDLSVLVRFALVCKSWLSVAIGNKQKHRVGRIPLLMLLDKLGVGEEEDEDEDEEEEGDQDAGGSFPSQENMSKNIIEGKETAPRRPSFYSIIGNRLFNFHVHPLPPSHERKSLCGSSYGWLAAVKKVTSVVDDAVQQVEVSLFHPFSGNLICLPPLIMFDLLLHEYAVDKLILSSDPLLDPTNYEVAVIYSGCEYYSLAIIKSGAKEWTYEPISPDLYIVDIVYYKGLLHCVCHQEGHRQIVSKVVDHESNNNKIRMEHMIMPLTFVDDDLINKPPGRPFVIYYLVESSTGELWCVRCLQEVGVGGSTIMPPVIGFGVYKFLKHGSSGDTVPDHFELEEIKSLGGDIIFLAGTNHSLCLSAADFPGCPANSILYAESFPSWMCRTSGPFEMRVFDMEKQTVQQHDTIKLASEKDDLRIPIWILPTLRGKLALNESFYDENS